MQKVLSSDLWKAVQAEAKKARQRKAAVAYVTQDLLGFRKGDLLLMDASTFAISSGETDAKLLRMLHERGVRLYHCEALHAKVILLDDVAVIGSGNMSKSSSETLVEAALMTDHTSTVAGVASFIEQLIPQSKELLAVDITKLCQIEVVRRGGRPTGNKQLKPKVSPLGNRMWLVGLHEIANDPPKREQEIIDEAFETLRAQTETPNDDFAWMRFGVKGRFPLTCQQGDSVIQIWRSSKAKRPSLVFRSRPVLLKTVSEKLTHFFLSVETKRSNELSWGNFQRLLKEIGYPRAVKPDSIHLLDPEIADAIARRWTAFAKAEK